MRKLREQLLALYRASEKAEDYFTFPVFYAVLCEKYSLDRDAAAEPDVQTQNALLQDAKRLLSGYPWQYLLGEADFYGRRFLVREGVLIPREETELLVGEAVKLLPEGGTFYDFCTGSGCIAVSLLLERPQAVGVAVDVSDEALSVCRENAAHHGVLDRLITRKRDLTVEPGASKAADLLCMNPPYLTEKELDEIPENVRCEPRLALFGGADGLSFYRRVLARLKEYVVPGGSALFEIGWRQGEDLKKLCRGFGHEAEILRDAEGRDRVVKITLAKNRNM